MLDESPRVFLSYGVRDASEIAERLQRDLAARGYQVWQDVSRLRVGRPWNEDVPEGPPWLRIVATTRNEQNVLNQLRGLTARELDAHDEQNLSDVRRFIAGRLTVATLQSAVIADGRSGEVLTEKLLTASSGNFLYVTMALKAVERGQLDFKTIELLPPGLSGMYKEFFDRLFAKAGVEFRQTRDVLEIVVDAREPLQLAARDCKERAAPRRSFQNWTPLSKSSRPAPRTGQCAQCP